MCVRTRTSGRTSDRYDERVDGVIDALGFDPDATIREALTATAHPERKIFFCFGIRQLIVKDFVNHGFIRNSKIWDYSDKRFKQLGVEREFAGNCIHE